MFERFTEQARRTVALAQEEARRLEHNYIGTEHLLLGLLAEGEGIAAKSLGSLSISLDAVRAEVEEIIGIGPGSPRHMPFTPRAKKILELSLREAIQLGQRHIGTEHILLGLIREGEGVAAQVLHRRAGGLHRVHQEVFTVLSHPVPLERPPSAQPPAPLSDIGEPMSPVEQRLTDIELAVQPLPDLLAGIARSLDGLVARVEALERRLGSGERSS